MSPTQLEVREAEFERQMTAALRAGDVWRWRQLIGEYEQLLIAGSAGNFFGSRGLYHKPITASAFVGSAIASGWRGPRQLLVPPGGPQADSLLPLVRVWPADLELRAGSCKNESGTPQAR
jgi:hypothetical protein